MILGRLILLFLITYHVCASVLINIEDRNQTLTKSEKSFLEVSVRNAHAHFQKIIPTDFPINILVNPQSCFRTGYNYNKKVINFCSSKSTLRMGINSLDIIHHEAFHYLLCRSLPDFCNENMIGDIHIQSIHEGLADYFSYQLSPDNFFGENYRIDFPFLRFYKNELCYNLVSTPHLKGSALSSFLIKNNYNWKDIISFIKEGSKLGSFTKSACFLRSTEQTILTPRSRKLSKSNRYWINKGEDIVFELKVAKKILKHFKEVKFKVNHSSDLFSYRLTSDTLTFSSKGPTGFNKIIVDIYSHELKIGEVKLYLGVR